MSTQSLSKKQLQRAGSIEQIQSQQVYIHQVA